MNEAVAMNVTLKCWIFKDSQLYCGRAKQDHTIRWFVYQITMEIFGKRLQFEFSRQN